MMLFVAVFAILLLTVHSQLTLDQVGGKLDRPVIGGVFGPFLSSPGLNFEPRLTPRSQVVLFTKGRQSTYERYLEKLTQFLDRYSNVNQDFENVYDCGAYAGYRPREAWERACRFDIVELGADCVRQQSFGFDDGQPCILLYMDRIYRWLPELYTNETIPEIARPDYREYHVTVTCEAEDDVSADNMGPVSIYPKHGFHVKYLPDLNQPGFLPPLVFVRFEYIRTAVLVRVKCKMWARNILHDRRFHTGMVSFAVLVD